MPIPEPPPGPRPGNAQWIGSRSEQQDAFGFAGFDGQGLAGDDGVLAVVADGMGGLSEGGSASRGAVAAFLSAWTRRPDGQPVQESLLAGIEAANRVVHDLACHSAGEGEVGTTLVAAAVQNRRLFWIASGDSRLYLYRAADDSMTACNEAHNLAYRFWREAPAHEATPAWIDSHPQSDHLSSFLGLAEIPELDRNVRPLALQPGDWLLLCSDGVDGVLTLDEMKECLNGDPQTVAEAIISRLQALGRPVQDNATVAILAYVEEPEAQEAIPAGPSRRARRWGIPYALGAIVLLLALLAGVWFWLGQGRLSGPETVAPTPPGIVEQGTPAGPDNRSRTAFAGDSAAAMPSQVKQE